MTRTHPSADTTLVRLALAELGAAGLVSTPPDEPGHTSRRHAGELMPGPASVSRDTYAR